MLYIFPHDSNTVKYIQDLETEFVLGKHVEVGVCSSEIRNLQKCYFNNTTMGKKNNDCCNSDP